MLSQSLKHAMNIYVFWLIVFFSAFIGIFSTKLISWIEVLATPQKRSASWIGRIAGKEKMYGTDAEKNRTQKEPGPETF